MLKVKLKKIESMHNNLRTNEMEGKVTHIPEEGYPFQIFGESLTEGADFRTITTTVVKKSEYKEDSRRFIFKTENSLYELKVLDERDPMEYKRDGKKDQTNCSTD